MESKSLYAINVVIWGIGILILLAAAFDVVPSVSDNKMIFFALACFIINMIIKRIAKGASCCK